MTANSRRHVERQAKDLLDGLGITAPPIDVQAAAKGLGYNVVFKYYADDELSGTVFRDEAGIITLGINTFHPPTRQRFSIAHEIGHAALHLTGRQRKDELFVDPPARTLFRDGKASLGEDRQEIEANQFAAGLLMPAEFVSRVGSQLVAAKPSISVSEVIEALAKQFDVSGQAMKYRLITLGVIEPD